MASSSERRRFLSAWVAECANRRTYVFEEGGRVLAVETHDLRQHHAHGLAVHDTEVCRERVGGGVGRPKHAVLDGHAGKGRAQLHAPARFEIVRI